MAQSSDTRPWDRLLSSARLGQRIDSTGAPSRSAFEQDYDRIIFSQPFRRLQDKTQVHPLPEHDFVHTRLTHSLEVSSVGRSLGKRVGEVIIQRHPALADQCSLFDFGAIVAAGALAHDLGNPPFGHAGETAMSDFFVHHPYGQSFRNQVTEAEWHDLIRFEGNAQGFRILNKNQYGLKCTFATLGAFTKYPVPANFLPRDPNRRSQKKFGYYQTETAAFKEVVGATGMLPLGNGASVRHPLAFLVEAADDICYSIIDLEDGCNLGLVSYAEARSLFESAISSAKGKLGKLDQLPSLAERIGFLRALAIGDLMEECSALFLDNEEAILNGTFDQALADHCPSKTALKDIIKVSVDHIYRARQVVEIEAAGHEVLPGLLHEFTQAGHHLLLKTKSGKYNNLQQLIPPDIRGSINQPGTSVYTMLRLILDFVSGLTDRHALGLFRKIKGISL
ncbi:MAG TPA: dNTP triphosphohydrolase [Chryseolinea sp.]|nr:dNTP triphosphohydrolase [Chryseolinea sp.]